MKYQAQAIVLIGGGLVDYASGWQASAKRAKAELDAILNRCLPAGIYSMSINVKRKAL